MQRESTAKNIRKKIGLLILLPICFLITTFELYALDFLPHIPNFEMQQELELNRTRWEEQNIAQYRFDLEIGCFCIFSYSMPVTIEVANGQMISMTDADGVVMEPGSSDAEIFESVGTVKRQFDLVLKGAREVDNVTVTYHEKYSFPTYFGFDWKQIIADDEFAYTISAFEILP
jgi:hypothetical protein